MLLGALSVTALLAACSSSSSPGPLGDGGVAGVQCMSYAQGQPVTTGLYDLDNTGTSSVTIQSVVLPSARDLRMTKAWLVPIYHDPRTGNFVDVGVGAPYPPTTAPQWPDRRPAIGGVIRPGKTLNLVFGLTRTTAASGKSAGPAITYTTGSSTWTVREATSLIVTAHC
jgi:hypothetical protein